jgi:glutaredoxin
MTKEYLNAKGVKYENVDVSASKENAQEMIDRSNQMGVPVIDVDGKLIIGFDKAELDKLLAK